MKTMSYLFAALAALFISPAIIGLVDAWAWIVLGEQATGSEWEIGRVMLAWFLLFPALLCLLAAMASHDAADRREG